jgi:hypothetical protein
MDEQGEGLPQWNGREVFDAKAEKIGTIAGLGYPRKKFGTVWLLVETEGARTVLVPGDQIRSSGDRLVLPYLKTYVEGGPAVENGQPPSQAEERRLRLHYGIDSGSLNSGCAAGCGMCMANRRVQRRRSHG